MKKGTTNINLKKLISDLNKQNKDIWKRVASDLERPRRIRRTVNLSRINRNIKDGEVALIPGKVLGDGTIEKKIEIAALYFSSSAEEKIKAAGGKTLTIQELIKKNPEAKGVRIIG